MDDEMLEAWRRRGRSWACRRSWWTCLQLLDGLVMLVGPWWTFKTVSHAGIRQVKTV